MQNLANLANLSENHRTGETYISGKVWRIVLEPIRQVTHYTKSTLRPCVTVFSVKEEGSGQDQDPGMVEGECVTPFLKCISSSENHANENTAFHKEKTDQRYQILQLLQPIHTCGHFLAPSHSYVL